MKTVLDVLKDKITSRKFLVAVAGLLSGVALVTSGNVEEGVVAIVSSVIAYLAAEGIIDLAAVKAKKDDVEEKLEDQVKDNLEDMK